MEIPGRYMLTDLIKSRTKDGKPYLRAIMCDKEGNRRNGIMFESNKLDFEPENGDIVDAVGMIQQFSGQDQLKISNMTIVKDADPSEFLPKKGIDTEALAQELELLLMEKITNEHLLKLVEKFFEDKETLDSFKKMPAAKSVHHAYVGGLIEHTLNIIKLSVLVGEYYKDLVNTEHLIMGALFHDLGKVKEMQAGTGLEYTDSGKLLGHLLLGVEMLNGYVAGIEGFPEELKYLLSHLIVSHHGLLEYGSPKKPKTPEAFVLHHLDDMDAKLNTFVSIFDREGVETGWSGYDRLLERQLFKHS